MSVYLQESHNQLVIFNVDQIGGYILCFSCNEFTGSDEGLKTGRYCSCVNPALLMTANMFVEVNDHWQNLVTTGREKQFANQCASKKSVEVILLLDGFDHCSHTSDEVVQIYNVLG